MREMTCAASGGALKKSREEENKSVLCWGV